MCIKILVYMIDNQQVKKNKHSFFWIAGCFPFPFSALLGLGGRPQKRQPGRGDFEEVARPAYPAYPRNPAYLYM